MPDVMENIRIFVGSEPKTEIARKVLELSIESRTDSNITYTPMIGKQWEYPKDLPVGTGFSLRRWMIAAHCQWAGLAIYLDADQVVFGDIAEIVRKARGEIGQAVIWCTKQPDKFSPNRAVPQTSVMLIDCARAREYWGFEIARIIEHLRAHPERYGGFMHANWIPEKLIGTLPTEWNHLNVYHDGKTDQHGVKHTATKLLHYTKENQQPWYNPGHPFAKLWELELIKAIRHGRITQEEFERALSCWGKIEDWRSMNGLHPHYESFLKLFRQECASRSCSPPAQSEPKPPVAAPAERIEESPVLWVTSFDPAIYEASGKALIESFLRVQNTGLLLCCTERKITVPENPQFLRHNLDKDPFLANWLKKCSGIIPKHLGGTHDGKCRCRGGPFGVHDKRHRQPCIGAWFNRNASRWFRKVASLHAARDLAVRNGYQLIVWVDADCNFTARATTRVVEGWFKINNKGSAAITGITMKSGLGVFYLKNRRPVLESGVIGFNLDGRFGGGAALDALFERYTSSKFRQDERWDDGYQIQRAVSLTRGVLSADLATNVGKEHADVVPFSPIAPFIHHDKGRHSRGLKLMT